MPVSRATVLIDQNLDSVRGQSQLSVMVYRSDHWTLRERVQVLTDHKHPGLVALALVRVLVSPECEPARAASDSAVLVGGVVFRLEAVAVAVAEAVAVAAVCG